MSSQLQRVLMVEDDPDIQMVARLSLEAVGGFSVEVCSDGHSALQLVDAFAPDLILLDVMMPEMDGPTVLKHLRARQSTCDVPVVFMTAKAQSQEIVAYLEMGALAVISKPFDPMQLPKNLTEIWEREALTNAKAPLGGDESG